jgi:hypothetical protein
MRQAARPPELLSESLRQAAVSIVSVLAALVGGGAFVFEPPILYSFWRKT